jgi:hypothetical protein
VSLFESKVCTLACPQYVIKSSTAGFFLSVQETHSEQGQGTAASSHVGTDKLTFYKSVVK